MRLTPEHIRLQVHALAHIKNEHSISQSFSLGPSEIQALLDR